MSVSMYANTVMSASATPSTAQENGRIPKGDLPNRQNNSEHTKHHHRKKEQRYPQPEVPGLPP